MQSLFSDQTRLMILIVACALLWSLESLIPLNDYAKDRFRRAVPNIALTLLLAGTNLLLSFASAQLVVLMHAKQVGLFFTIRFSPWLTLVLGIAVLDLFAYFAHSLLHKSWVGWQFHRVHHCDNDVNVTTAFRQHPGETVWRVLWQVLAVAIFGLSLVLLAVLMRNLHRYHRVRTTP